MMKKRISPVQVVRALIQLLAFIFAPALFITIFSSIGEIYKALISGSFTLESYIGRIILVAAVFIVTFIWGRFFCGFICSFGAMQDLLWAGRKHFPKRLRIPEKADRVLKYLKYVILVMIIIFVWTLALPGETVWSPWTVFGMYSSPLKGFASAEFLLSVGALLLLLIIIGSLFIERFFCKYLCPLGALFTLASRFRLFKIKKPKNICGNCRACSKSCSMSIPLYKNDRIKSGECIDCMRCQSACPNNNVKASALPAISGTLAVTTIAGLYSAGIIPMTDASEKTATVSGSETVGKYKDGTYTGSGYGYRGNINVSVTVSLGNITDITVTSHNDDYEFFSKAQSVISSIINAQDTNVSTVSGATFSSRGIIEAVADALNITEETTAAQSEEEYYNSFENDTEADTQATEQETENDNSASFKDGTYTGSGTGYRGETDVKVTVKNGKITDITITSYQDDEQFFSRAQQGVVSSIISQQSTDVSTVSGATFSSNGIIEAVSDALGIEFTNPNSSMNRGGHMHGNHEF